MNIMNKKSNKDCPEFEELSAYFDGELDPSSSVYKHIESCETCKNELESLRRVSDSIKQEFAAEVPDDFPVRIIASIKERQEKKMAAKPFPLNTAIRIAALFIISALIVFNLIPKEENIAKSQSSQKAIEPLVFLNRPTLAGSLTALPPPPSRRSASGANGTIDLRRMMNVSTGNMSDEILSLPPDQTAESAVIRPEVHQVWSVDNLDSAENQIAKFAPSAKFAKDATGNRVMNVQLTKKELAELVRECKAAGFRLLSPSQPQPEQKVFAGRENDKVLYNAVFVKPE